MMCTFGGFSGDSTRKTSEWEPDGGGVGGALTRASHDPPPTKTSGARIASLVAALLACSSAASLAQGVSVTCSSDGGRRHCAADTSAGILMTRQLPGAACLLGKTWGYDDQGVWVDGGCSAEFLVARVPAAPAAPPPTTPEPPPQVPVAGATPAPAPHEPTDRIESWGEFEPGEGFLVGRSKAGELAISAYALVRYLNQDDSDGVFTDHLGNVRTVDGRNDVYPHRAMVFFKGWAGDPRLVYNIFVWTVNTTDQDALFGNLGWQQSRKFSLYGGINGFPGTRSLQGSHPYWLGHDRVMADEFFRPYFSFGVWAQGEPIPGLWYNVMVGDNLSGLGITAVQMDRDFGWGGSMWWMPTTHEFGPKGAYGDWEWHEDLATRFGISATESNEDRQTNGTDEPPDNTTIRLADSLNVFEIGALAPGVVVRELDYRVLSLDAGFKYRGFFVQTELYTRWLDDFVTTGPIPVSELRDQGFYVQAAFYPVKQTLELYAVTSQIFGDEDAGFDDSSEYLGGLNWYPLATRNHRLNIQVGEINHSPVSSTFGYYVGGLDGWLYSSAFSIYF